MSRRLTNSADRSIAIPVAKTASIATISGSSSQLSIGVTPSSSAKPSTTTRFSARLNDASSTTESGITMRGNWILRTRFSRSTTLRTDAGRGFDEEREQNDRAQQLGAVVLLAGDVPLVHVGDLVKNTYSTPNSSSGRISCHR